MLKGDEYREEARRLELMANQLSLLEDRERLLLAANQYRMLAEAEEQKDGGEDNGTEQHLGR